MVRDDPALISRLLTVPTTPALRTGLFGTSGIVTSVVVRGMYPQDQFPVVFQSESTNPVQVRSAEILIGLVAITTPHPPAAAIVFVTV